MKGSYLPILTSSLHISLCTFFELGSEMVKHYPVSGLAKQSQHLLVSGPRMGSVRAGSSSWKWSNGTNRREHVNPFVHKRDQFSQISPAASPDWILHHTMKNLALAEKEDYATNSHYLTYALLDAFLWEYPDPDIWSVAFLTSESLSRSVISRIHSGAGFIRSLISAIRRQMIGSMVRRVPLAKDPKLITVYSDFSLWMDKCDVQICLWIQTLW